MRADDLADYGQAKACPFFVLASGEVRLVEALPDLVLVFFGNSDPVVLDAHEDFTALFRRLDLDLGLVAAEFDRVVDEVVEDLLYFVHVGVNVEDAAGQDQADADLPAQADMLERGGDFPDDVVDVPVGHVEDHAPRVEVVERQQAVGELGEAVRLVEDDSQIVLVHLGRDRAVQHGLQESTDGSQRGAEVMGDVRDELLLVVLEARHGLGHVAKGRREVAKFVLSFHSQFVVHVARSVLLGRRDDLAKRAVDDLRKEDQDDQGQEQDHDEHQVGDVEHAVGALIDLRRGLVDDHVSSGLVFIDDGGNDAELLLLEGVKKGAPRVVVLLRDGGIEALHDDLRLGIRRVGGIDDHPARGIDDPDLRVHEIGEGFHLFLHRFEGDVGIVQVHRIGVRDPHGFAVHVP